MQNTVLERDFNGIKRAIKMAYVDLGDSTSSDPEDTLSDATLDPELPDFGDPYETNSLCKHNRRVARPIVGGKAWVELHYLRPEVGVPAGVAPSNEWRIIDYDGGMVGVQTSRLPGSGVASWEDTFWCSYETPDDFGSGESTNAQLERFFARGPAAVHIFTAPVRRPVRVITMAGIFDSEDHALVQSAFACQGKVNDAEIHTYGVGFWLCESIKLTDLGGNQGWMGIARIVTMMNEDWSSWLFMRNQQGDPVKPRTEVISGTTHFKGAGTEYEFSIRPADEEERMQNGFLRIGPYETVNFQAGFGIA